MDIWGYLLFSLLYKLFAQALMAVLSSITISITQWWQKMNHPFAARWMDPKTVMLSELSQTEKEKWCMTSLIWGILKKWYKWPYLQIRKTDRKWTYGCQWGRMVREERVWVWYHDVYTAIYLKWLTIRVLLYSIRELCSVWYGSLDGRGSLGKNEYMYIFGWVPLLSTWNYHNIVNWIYSNIK